MQPVINYVAVAVAAVVRFALGAVWYSLLFGAKWQEYTGLTEDKMRGESVAMTYGGALVIYFIQAYVLAHFIHYTNAKDAKGGAQCGFWIWLGFNAVLLMQTKLFQAQPIGLFFINAGYELVSLLAMGIILAMWQKKATA
jgi:hypothetical protein